MRTMQTNLLMTPPLAEPGDKPASGPNKEDEENAKEGDKEDVENAKVSDSNDPPIAEPGDKPAAVYPQACLYQLAPFEHDIFLL